MRVFVTGGTGFVGKRTVGRLIEGGHGVRCLLRSASRAGELEQLGCETAYGDVTDKASVLEGMRGCEWVLQEPQELQGRERGAAGVGVRLRPDEGPRPA